MKSTGTSGEAQVDDATGAEIAEEIPEEVSQAFEEETTDETEISEDAETIAEASDELEAAEEEEIDPNAELKAEVAELEAKVKAARESSWRAEEKAAQSGKIGYMRLAAEFESYKNQIRQKKADEEAFMQVEVLRKMITILDDLASAPEEVPSTTEGEEAIHKNYQTLYNQLEERFKDFGLTTFEGSIGEKYNPLLHEALSYVDVEEPDQVAGTIKSQVREGSRTPKGIVRRALVEVFQEKVLDVVSEEGGDEKDEKDTEEHMEEAESNEETSEVTE